MFCLVIEWEYVFEELVVSIICKFVDDVFIYLGELVEVVVVIVFVYFNDV